MATYVIMYDLNKEGDAYAEANKKLTDRIKKLFDKYWHHLDSTWAVVTELSHKQIRDDFWGYMDENDELLVVKSSGVAAWEGFIDKGSKWLKKNI